MVRNRNSNGNEWHKNRESDLKDSRLQLQLGVIKFAQRVNVEEDEDRLGQDIKDTVEDYN